MTSAVQDRLPSALMAVDLGVRWSHGPGYTVERPYGLGMYLFVCFHSPMSVQTTEGVVPAEPGDCLLYDPSFPQWYRGRDAGFVDDWLHMDGPAMPEVIQRYQIPLNAIMRPRGTEFVTPIFEAINRERRRREPLWLESVGLMIQGLFLQLGRQLVQQTPGELTPAEATRVDEFRNLRMHVHERMQKPWRVAEMAGLAHLSPSRFAVLYAKLLGVSPMEDLIHARLHRARALLTDGGISVGDAANRSGFGSVCHFSRLFRKHVGCAPRDYHRRLVAGESNLSDPRGEMSNPLYRGTTAA
jgi:AraC-like DNA-binding protein